MSDKKKKRQLEEKLNLPDKINGVIYGGGGVGKTSVLLRFLKNHFEDEYDPTIEDTYLKEIVLEDGKKHILEILDTAGGGEYTVFRDQYIRDAVFFIIIFGINSRWTYDEVEMFVEQVRRYKDEQFHKIVIVGNKKDLDDKENPKNYEERQVSTREVEEWAHQAGLPYREVSALTGEGVEDMFLDTVMYLRDGVFPHQVLVTNIKRAR